MAEELMCSYLSGFQKTPGTCLTMLMMSNKTFVCKKDLG